MESEYRGKQLSNPISTGGGGGNFEIRVQASFVILMLLKVKVAFLWHLPVTKVLLQRRFEGYHTEDVVVELGEGDIKRKLLGQIKRTISITAQNKIFQEVITAAWNDYNGDYFQGDRDGIALITGPLSKADQSVRELLEWARSSESADYFFRKIDSRISSKEKRDKLNVFKTVLRKANCGKAICKEDIFSFLQHFYLLSYDFDIEVSIHTSLMCGMMQLSGISSAYDMWAKTIFEVENFNQNAGEITLDTLPEDLVTLFLTKQKLPVELVTQAEERVICQKWPESIDSYIVSNIIYFVLIGAWDEKNDKDKELIERLSGISYDLWRKSIQTMLNWPDTPLKIRNNIWRLMDREHVWQHVGKLCVLDDLTKFQKEAVIVLSEISHVFDVNTEKRYVLYGERFSYSELLRRGIAEGIYILSKCPTVTKQIDSKKIQNIVFQIIDDILKKESMNFWGSIDSLLPILAKAAPEAFLNNVERTTDNEECPFEILFLQEKRDLWGQLYTTGLFSALETLSWNKELFIRVCCVLAQLAKCSESDKAKQVLVEIFLPWITNTNATIDERIRAIHCIQEENFEIAWSLLLQLLPNKVRYSLGVQQPKDQIDISKQPVTVQTYWDTINVYIIELIKMVKETPSKLPELIRDIWLLPQKNFSDIINFICTYKESLQDKRLQKAIWKALQDALLRYYRYPNAFKNITKQQIIDIKVCIEKYCPQDSIEQSSFLFIKNEDILYKRKANVLDEHKRLEKKRYKAICQIFAEKNLDGIIKLATIVENSESVGRILGTKGSIDIDLVILPKMLFDKRPSVVNFANAYANSRYCEKQETWVESLPVHKWSIEEKGSFLLALPFCHKIWPYIEQFLGKQESLYWDKKNSYSIDVEHYDYAIDKLIKYNRTCTAIKFLYHLWIIHHIFDVNRICNALLHVTGLQDAGGERLDEYIVSELIKDLQQNADTDINKLEQIEWQYAQVLKYNNVYTDSLYRKISHDALYFCQLIQVGFPSKTDNVDSNELDEYGKNIATNAWYVLEQWNIIPGMDDAQNFSMMLFNKWYEVVKFNCTKSEHLHVANRYIGGVLTFAPQDEDGLWIYKDLAKFLNKKDATDIRRGFFSKIINSRGAHWVNPKSTEEINLSIQYEEKAKKIEALGYRRFASTLRELSNFYKEEAENNKSRLAYKLDEE